VKFKQYLKESSRKDILKRHKNLKKMSVDQLEKLAEVTSTNETEMINIILFNEFREIDIDLAFNGKEIK